MQRLDGYSQSKFVNNLDKKTYWDFQWVFYINEWAGAPLIIVKVSVQTVGQKKKVF